MADALFDPETYAAGIPHAVFRRLRDEDPVAWQTEPGGRGFWAVTRYEDVVAVSRRPALFSSEREGAQLADLPAPLLETARAMMLNMDPPRHTRYRRLVSAAFTARTVERLEPRIRARATGLVDAMAARGACDFVEAFAAELPMRVIAEMLGVPEEDHARIIDWSDRLTGSDDPELSGSIEASAAAAAEMWGYASVLADARRREPRDDLMTALVHAEVDGARLDEMELAAFFLILAVAGNETTRNLLSGGLRALVEHPDVAARLRARPALLDGAVDELLRWVTPVMCFRRTATADTTLRDTRIHEGDKVVVYHVSANRDERTFPDPDRLDVERSPNLHLAFGFGEHFCLGSALARLEGRIAFDVLLGRLRDVALDGEPRRLRSNFLNGFKSLPIRFRAA